jgi:hypothetical protein
MSIGVSGGRKNMSRQQAQIAEWVERLRSTGGEISLYAHECEFATQTFWDAVNYSRGTDTPRERWQPAPLLSKTEREERYAAMDEFLTFVQSLPDVQIVVASEASLLYRDRAKGRSFTPHQIAQACVPMADGITHQKCDGIWLAPAEIYGLVVALVAARVRDGRWPDHVPYRYLDGPPPPFPMASPDNIPTKVSHISLDDLYGVCLYEDAYLNACGRMPARVQVRNDWLMPANFLATVGAFLSRWLNGSMRDAPIMCGSFLQAKYVPDHVSWDWLVFPAGFSADPLMLMGQLQAWTLKPAPLVH